MARNLKFVSENEVERFLDRLYAETDCTQRDVYQTLLLGEPRRCGTLEERRDILERWMRVCDGRLVWQRALIAYKIARSDDPQEAQVLLGKMLKVQSILRAELRVALRD